MMFALGFVVGALVVAGAALVWLVILLATDGDA